MRFSAVALMGLVGMACATATPTSNQDIVERGYSKPVDNCPKPTVILNAFAVIKKGTVALDQAILAINSGDLLALLALDDQVQALTAVLQTQIGLVKKAPKVALKDVIYVANRAQNLVDNVVKALRDLKTIRQYTTEASVNILVVKDVIQLQYYANLFVDALSPAVPSIAKFLIRVDRKQLNDAFSDADAYFRKRMSPRENCSVPEKFGADAPSTCGKLSNVTPTSG